MYDHESADLSRLLYLWTMPRVVEDQREKFQTDEFFTNLSRPTEVRYTKLPHAPEAERRAQFNQDCQEGRIPITFLPSGFNLDLTVVVSEGGEAPGTSDDAPTSSSLSPQGPSDVEISCPVILNGVCVRWKGIINRNSLRGQGCLEFDESRAEVTEIQSSRTARYRMFCERKKFFQEENRMLRSEMQVLGERFRQLEQQFLPPPISQNHGSDVITTTVPPIVTTEGS